MTIMKFTRQIFVGVSMAVMLLSACAVGSDSTDEVADTLLKAGEKAPDFTLALEQGQRQLTLDSLQGKVVIVEFWASWCPDCRKVTAQVAKLFQQYAASDTVCVGISFDTDALQWQQYMAEHALSGLQHREQQPWKESKVAADYHVNWIPTFYVINKAGRIDYATIDIKDLESFLVTTEKGKQ